MQAIRTIAKIFITLFSIGLLVLWTYLQFISSKATQINFYFNIGVGLMYFITGLIALVYSLKDIKKPMKNFLSIYGFGLISWGIAALIWGYYNLVAHMDIPYPSYADYFFILYSLLMGASFWFYFDIFKTKINKTSLRDSFLIVSIIYFFIFFVLYKPSYELTAPWLEIIFNYLYPLLDATILSLAVIALRIEENKNVSSTLTLVVAVLSQVIGDIVFSFRMNNSSYWNGDISDLFFLISAIFYFISILRINKDFIHLSKPDSK
ncbi:MAG: hypothetical protein WA061_03890 [Microgenomates group bacterium]